MVAPVWPQFITWLLVVLGWIVVHFLGEARERKKEVRAELDSIYDAIHDSRRMARNFHCSDTFDGVLARDVLVGLESIERRLLRMRFFDDREIAPGIVRLRQAISLRNFTKSEFSKQDENSEILGDISFYSEELIDELENVFRQHYPDRFPYYRRRGSPQGPAN